MATYLILGYFYGFAGLYALGKDQAPRRCTVSSTHASFCIKAGKDRRGRVFKAGKADAICRLGGWVLVGWLHSLLGNVYL